MGIKINTKRVFTFPVVVGEDNATVTFDFLASAERTDWDVVDVLKKSNGGNINFFLLNLRCALVSWTGFDNEDGELLEFNTINQMAVFEFIRNDNVLYDKILTAFRGEANTKNLETGLQQSSSSDGTPPPVTVVQRTEDVEDA